MNEHKQLELFHSGKVSTAVLKNAVPAMIAMLMVLVYNLADTFFIGQTHDDLQVAAVAMCTPVFLIFMSVGTIFGLGGTSVISRSMGKGRTDYARKVSAFCMWCCVTASLLSVAIAPASPVSAWLDFIGSIIVAAYLVWCGIRTIWEAAGQ